jgi:hypothetical protein
VKVHSTGGVYVWDSDQETPNFQIASFEYADGTVMDVQLTNLYAPESKAWNVFCTSRGYLTSEGEGWKASLGEFSPRARIPEVTPAGVNEKMSRASFPQARYVPGPPVEGSAEPQTSHFANFIDCMRSRKVEDLRCDILEGHMSATLCHIANISYRTGRKLVFDPTTERFTGDEEANRYLTRSYRAPYVLPEVV